MRRLALAGGALLLAGCSAPLIDTFTDPATTTIGPSPSVTQVTSGAVVVRVVDGDTLVVRDGPEQRTVRILAIDTPETVAPGRPVACWGPEATAATAALLPAGTPVELGRDPIQADEDRYGRQLRYVAVGGTDVGLELLRGGNARPYKISGRAPTRWNEYVHAGEAAREARVGMWGACSG